MELQGADVVERRSLHGVEGDQTPLLDTGTTLEWGPDLCCVGACQLYGLTSNDPGQSDPGSFVSRSALRSSERSDGVS